MAKFCGKCGTPLNPDGTCSNCHAVYNTETSKNDTVKGNENTAPKSTKKEAPKKKKKTGLIVIAAVVVIALILLALTAAAGITAFFVLRSQNSEQQSEAVNTVTVTVDAAVNNEFDLFVLNYEGTDHIQYNLKIIKEELSILDIDVSNGTESLNLEDGTYQLRITDINTEDDKTNSIDIWVTVDSSNSETKDKIVIKTDFTDITVEVTKESAPEAESEPATVSPEDVVDIYMDNIDVWRYDTIENPRPMYGYYHTFIDLDMDGILEMITGSTDGTMRITYNRYYKVDVETETVYEIGLDGTDESVSFFDFGYIGSDYFKLLKNKSTGEFYYWAIDYTQGVDGEYSNSYGIVKYNNGKVTEEALFDEYTAPEGEYYEDVEDAFAVYKDGSWVKMEKSAYDEALDAYMSQHEDMKLTFSSVHGYYFEEESTAEKRNQLLDAYTSFSYNGFQTEETGADSENKSSWQQEYKNILNETAYKYYALYDIDKDGTPELLLNDYSGGFECFVYGYDGKNTVEYGSIPNKYGIYGYDGNGIIYSTGGTGVLCYSVYTADNGILTEEDTALLLYNIHPGMGIEEYKHRDKTITSEEFEKKEKEITEKEIEFFEVTDLNIFESESAASPLSAEELGKKLVLYLMKRYEPDGEYVVSSSETTKKDNMITFIVRYQMSDARAEEIISNGGIPAANTLVGAYTVDSITGDVYDEDDVCLFNLFN